jgi:hypothetical protein
MMLDRSDRPIAILALLCAGLLVAACASSDSTASLAPSITAGPAPSASASPSAPGGTQTETGWGRIWDNVPTGFPRFPGSTVADPVGPEPVSGTYAVVNDDTAQVAGWMQNALETASFGTESLSGPLEDGGFVLESVGEGECRIQTSVRPMGGLTFVIVRYGAACPPG